MRFKIKRKGSAENNNNINMRKFIIYLLTFSLGLIIGLLFSKCPTTEEQKIDITLKEKTLRKEEKFHKESHTLQENVPQTYPEKEKEIEEKIYIKKETYEIPTTKIYYEKITCPDLPISAELLDKPGQYSNKKEAIFKIKLKINTKCSLEGFPIPCTFTAERVKVEFQEDGEKEFKVSYGEPPCMKDLISYNFIVDTTPPETKIIPVGFDKVVTTYHSVIFEFATNEPVKSILCKIDDGFWIDCSSGRIFPTNIEEGWHKLFVFSTDLAGNKEDPPKEYAFLIDALPPTTLLLSAPPSITNSRSAEFVFTSDDEEAKFECKINDKEWEKCSSPLILKDLQEGINKIKIRSFDKYGRYEDEPVIYSWRVVSGEIKVIPNPTTKNYEEVLKRQKRYKKE